MTSPLFGRSVAVAEGRQLDDLVEMLSKEGAVPIRCPLVSILDNPDSRPVISWIENLVAGRFNLVIVMTGEAIRRLVAVAERAGLRDALIAALEHVATVTRGPKPVRALKELGLSPTFVAERPTTDGVIASLKSMKLAGAHVGLTLYGEPNATLEQFLIESDATVHTVMPYIYAPASDAGKVVDLIRAMEKGQVHGIIFTSSPQVERLFEVARESGIEATLRSGLSKTCVAAVGPVVAELLAQNSVRVDVCPEQGFVMKNLVLHLKRKFTNDNSS
jgi:uroporphyrinogen-III synthase